MEKVQFENITLVLTQAPYIAGDNGRPHFEAMAQDENGDAYMIRWDVRDNWRELAETGDDSELCEWDHPAAVEKL